MSESSVLGQIKTLLYKMPDVERGLCSIYHRKVNYETKTYLSRMIFCIHDFSCSVIKLYSRIKAYFIRQDITGSLFTFSNIMYNGSRRKSCDFTDESVLAVEENAL